MCVFSRGHGKKDLWNDALVTAIMQLVWDISCFNHRGADFTCHHPSEIKLLENVDSTLFISKCKCKCIVMKPSNSSPDYFWWLKLRENSAVLFSGTKQQQVTQHITRMSIIRNPVMLMSHMLITAAFGRLLENMRVCVGYVSASTSVCLVYLEPGCISS